MSMVVVLVSYWHLVLESVLKLNGDMESIRESGRWIHILLVRGFCEVEMISQYWIWSFMWIEMLWTHVNSLLNVWNSLISLSERPTMRKSSSIHFSLMIYVPLCVAIALCIGKPSHMCMSNLSFGIGIFCCAFLCVPFAILMLDQVGGCGEFINPCLPSLLCVLHILSSLCFCRALWKVSSLLSGWCCVWCRLGVDWHLGNHGMWRFVRISLHAPWTHLPMLRQVLHWDGGVDVFIIGILGLASPSIVVVPFQLVVGLLRCCLSSCPLAFVCSHLTSCWTSRCFAMWACSPCGLLSIFLPYLPWASFYKLWLDPPYDLHP